jgi:hypothetical protein
MEIKMKMLMTVPILRILMLSLVVGLLGTSAAAAGEGSADIGPQPPWGYYPNERGHPSPADGMRDTYEFAAPRAGRTARERD